MIRLPKTAGIYLLQSGGYVGAFRQEYFDSACEIYENVEITPFAFRVHTHKLGLVNSGYVVKLSSNFTQQKWVEIGRRSPHLPQIFLPIKNHIVVKTGDILAARCTMNNTRNYTVFVG